MPRRPIAALSVLALFAGPPAQATIIDSFESGPLSMTLGQPGSIGESQAPSPGHCIASERFVTLYYDPDATGTMAAELTPVQNTDDALLATLPSGDFGEVRVDYNAGAAWDLTAQGADRFSLRITGVGFGVDVTMYVLDSYLEGGNVTHVINQAGTHHFDFSEWPASTDFTMVETIGVSFVGATGATWGLQNVETSRTLEYALAWDVLDDVIYVVPGIPPIGHRWNWLVPYDGQIPIQGPQLTLQGFAPNYNGLQITGDDSGGEIGSYGATSILNVFWEAPSFEGASFQMDFLTQEDVTYGAQLIGEPDVVSSTEAVVIGHDLLLTGMEGLPNGLFHQDLIMIPSPGQDLRLENVQVFPVGLRADEAGYKVLFDTSGSVDVEEPLMEIYVTGSYIEGSTVTGIAARPEVPAPMELHARPTVSRDLTRLVLSRPARHPGSIDVFDVGGRMVRRLRVGAGTSAVDWDGRDGSGSAVSSGVYFARFTGDSIATPTARIIRLR